jgi:hypothetical protein
MIQRLGVTIIATACLWFGGRAIVRWLASDETKIRWRIESACEGFGATRMDPILELFAREFRDETSGATRDDLRAGIAAAFFQEKDPQTKKFPYRAVVPREELSIEVSKSDPKTATVRFLTRIVDTRGGKERIAWEFRANGAFKHGDDGWQLVSTSHVTSTGNSRLR